MNHGHVSVLVMPVYSYLLGEGAEQAKQPLPHEAEGEQQDERRRHEAQHLIHKQHQVSRYQLPRGRAGEVVAACSRPEGLCDEERCGR